MAVAPPLGNITSSADPKRPLAFASFAFATTDGSIFYITSRGGVYLLSVYVGSTGDLLGDEPVQVSLSIPEIPTWAMMLSACAGAGVAGRRRGVKVRAWRPRRHAPAP